MPIDDPFNGDKYADHDEIWKDFADYELDAIVYDMKQLYAEGDDEDDFINKIVLFLEDCNVPIQPINELNCSSNHQTNDIVNKQSECTSESGYAVQSNDDIQHTTLMANNENAHKTNQSPNTQQKFLFECVNCSRTYRHVRSLQRHKRASCIISKLNPSNNQHIKQLDKAIKLSAHAVFACKKCPRKFPSSRSLNNHNRIHVAKTHHTLQRHKRSTSHAVFACDKCSRQFLSKISVKNHNCIHVTKNNDQSDKKLHSCSVCSKQFIKSVSLRNHKRSHFHSKIHNCTLCTKSYTFKAYLKKHMERHANAPIEEK